MSKSDASVTRLFGGPGSGKTTALLDRVDELLTDEEFTADSFTDYVTAKYGDLYDLDAVDD